ncbi:MAG: hypothetical protein R2827_16120 [Bdellovibrionales bacterium]
MRFLSILLILFLAIPGLSAVVNQSKFAADGISLRQKRKVGVGMTAMGAYGVTGVNLELNFTPKISALTGFGIGDGYQTFNFQIKQNIGGTNFIPYVTAGYTRWYTTSNELRAFKETTPEFLAKKFLSSTERRGRFAEDIIYPSAGVQFVMLNGEWAGFAINAEFLFLVDVDDLVSAPAGALGFSYYF